MASGDVWVAYAWQGAYALLRAQDVPVAYANPEEGRNSWVGYYGIRKGTENLDNAYAFLDGKLADETAQTSSISSTTAPPTRTSWTPSRIPS